MRFTLFTTLAAFAVVAAAATRNRRRPRPKLPHPRRLARRLLPPPPSHRRGGRSEDDRQRTSVAAFDPNKLTVKSGTIVRFINVSGGRTTSRSTGFGPQGRCRRPEERDAERDGDLMDRS